jgi:hypothetical protein
VRAFGLATLFPLELGAGEGASGAWIVLRFPRIKLGWRKRMPERTQKPTSPAPWEPKQGGGDGPKSPDVSKPDTNDLLKRMKKVDPNQSKRYRQRTGQ